VLFITQGPQMGGTVER